jgi:hypothetical protein
MTKPELIAEIKALGGKPATTLKKNELEIMLDALRAEQPEKTHRVWIGPLSHGVLADTDDPAVAAVAAQASKSGTGYMLHGSTTVLTEAARRLAAQAEATGSSKYAKAATRIGAAVGV